MYFLGGGSLGSVVVGSGGPCSCYSFFYVNLSGMHLWSRLSFHPLVIQTPWVLLHIGWSILVAPPWVTASCFLEGNREAKLKSTIFSTPTFPCFPVFPLRLNPQQYDTFECCLLELLNNNNIYWSPSIIYYY